MSNRNQLRTIKKVLAGATAEFLAKETRAVIASYEKPEFQNERAFPTARGQWLTAADVKQHFGPSYATDATVIEQTLSVYISRLVDKAAAEVGVDIRSLTSDQVVELFGAVAAAEKVALMRMTMN